MKKLKLLTTCFLFLFIAGIFPAQAVTRTWVTASGTNDWFNPANWDGGITTPGAGDDVQITIAGAAVLLTNSTPYLGSLTLSKTIVFSNWNTKLSATNVTIQSGGIITLPVSFTTNQMSNNVYFVCSNFMLLAGGKINVDGRGYTGGLASASSPAGDGYGPGAGVANGYGIGAGYGGRGGPNGPGGSPAYDYPGAHPYGSLTAPTDPGSGGGGSGGGGGLYEGGCGGGAVRIDADAVMVNGTITANGTTGSGGGSGGSIYITCRTFDGTNGMLSAKGGSGYPQHNTGGHGGGGRISVIYNIAAQTAVPTVSFLANPGSLAGQYGAAARGDPGTIYLPDNKFITATLTNFYGQVWGFSSLSFSTFTVSNTWVRFPAEGFQLTVTGDLTVMGSSGMLQLGGDTINNAYQSDPRYQDASAEYWYGPAVSCTTSAPVLNVGGNLILTNSGSLVLFSAMTNAGPGTTNYGALVSVTNDVWIGSSSALYPYSHPTNGGSVLIRAKNVKVISGGAINANGKGFAGTVGGYGFGPGGGGPNNGNGRGGGYGGVGGSGLSFVGPGGPTYGSISAPTDPGSGSGNSLAGAGGGLVRIAADENVTVNGTVIADGTGVGGSGGGIYITCKTFSGTNGFLSAGGTGGGWHPGAGGGGRIAIVYDTGLQSASAVNGMQYRVAGGYSAQHPGDMGTLYFPDDKLLSTNLVGWQGKLWGITNWSVQNLMVSNSIIRFAADGFRLTVSNNLTLDMSGRLEIGGPMDDTINYLAKLIFAGGESHWRYIPFPCGIAVPPVLTVGGNLTMTDNASLSVYSVPTNSPASSYGALVVVTQTMLIAGNNAWVYPFSHPTNGGSPLFRVRYLTINSTNSGIDASEHGFAIGKGPGVGGNTSSGGGYGGKGGGTLGGSTYGSSNAPVAAGSGSGGGGSGGGSVRIEVSQIFLHNGAILANGLDASAGGSGGGVYITCKKFSGTSGVIYANGGNGYTYAGGGGGRIAVWSINNLFTGALSVPPGGGAGDGKTGAVGTLVLGKFPYPGTIISVP